jgi:FlaA1/EpsC-like NDP-sugar epimerase
MLAKEEAAGITTSEYYRNFQSRVDIIRNDMLTFLLDKYKAGQKVIGYGAAAKGNTLLNYAGIKGDSLIKFVVDAAPSKQGKYLPGSHIPVYDEAAIRDYKPDFIIILPWNLKEEIMEQLAYIADWGGKFVAFVPSVQIYDPKLAHTQVEKFA